MNTTFRHRNLPGLLLQAREAVMAQRRPALRAQGLSDQQWRVLRALDRVGHEGLDTGALAQAAFILGPSLTGTLERMQRDGLVTRQRSEADARRWVVYPTAKGQQVIAALAEHIEAQYAQVELALGRERLAALYDTLDALIDMNEERDAHD